MDMLIVNMVAATVFGTGLVICLEVVSFGRVAKISAALALLSGAVSIICLQFVPALWDKSTGTLAEIDDVFVQTDRLLFASQATLAMAFFAAGVFCIAGSLRVWSLRSVLISRFSKQHILSAHSVNSVPASNRNRICAVVGILMFIAMIGWDLYDFIVTDRGFQFYEEQLHMLLYPIGAATLVGVVLALFSRFARRHSKRNNNQGSQEQAT